MEHNRLFLYDFYDGDELIATGTIKELSDKLNLKESTLRYYARPTYHDRIKNGKKVFKREAGK